MDDFNFKPILLCGDASEQLRTLDAESVDCCVTSPPYYGLRDYGVSGQIGLEETPEEYIENLVSVFREVRRVLKKDGTLWVNIADSYAGSGKGPEGNLSKGADFRHLEHKSRQYKTESVKPKDLIGIPWMLAFALRADGWYLRQEIIWAKPACMPESVTDRCTKSHESIFLLAKSRKYFFDANAIKEPCVQTEFANGFRGGAYCNNSTFDNSSGGKREVSGNKNYPSGEDDYGLPLMRNKRDVWTIGPRPFAGAHFATFPIELPELCLLAGSRKGGTVLDVFNGAGTTGVAAMNNGRNYIGIELNPKYVEITERRFAESVKYSEPMFEV